MLMLLQTWVTWSEDPNEWLPINHCCDPNTWLEGLDLVARRDIRKGEQVSAFASCVFMCMDVLVMY